MFPVFHQQLLNAAGAPAAVIAGDIASVMSTVPVSLLDGSAPLVVQGLLTLFMYSAVQLTDLGTGRGGARGCAGAGRLQRTPERERRETRQRV